MKLYYDHQNSWALKSMLFHKSRFSYLDWKMWSRFRNIDQEFAYNSKTKIVWSRWTMTNPQQICNLWKQCPPTLNPKEKSKSFYFWATASVDDKSLQYLKRENKLRQMTSGVTQRAQRLITDDLRLTSNFKTRPRKILDN